MVGAVIDAVAGGLGTERPVGVVVGANCARSTSEPSRTLAGAASLDEAGDLSRAGVAVGSVGALG